jgi:8-oxo-dGTP diphosphatase
MAIAIKSMIVNDGKLLILKRADDDIHKPGIWEIPGGRIKKNEDIILGLKRETKEETGLDIDVNRQISVRYFTRDDKQEIEMHIFLCNALNNEIELSEEHSEYEWIEIEKSKKKLTEFFHPEIDLLLNLENDKWP